MPEKFKEARAEQAQNFLPVSPEEKELWEDLDCADKPIVSILKRLNRIARREFPKSGIKTEGSCSGHVQEDGSLANAPTLPELVGKVNKHPREPEIMFSAPAKNVSSKQRKQIEQSLNAFFESVIDSTNKQLGLDCISLDNSTKPFAQDVIYSDSNSPRKTYIFGFFFSLAKQVGALAVLQAFWGNVEEELSKVDRIEEKTQTEVEDFLEGEIREGFVRVK